jgi:hypothetical protein
MTKVAEFKQLLINQNDKIYHPGQSSSSFGICGTTLGEKQGIKGLTGDGEHDGGDGAQALLAVTGAVAPAWCGAHLGDLDDAGLLEELREALAVDAGLLLRRCERNLLLCCELGLLFCCELGLLFNDRNLLLRRPARGAVEARNRGGGAVEAS